MDDPEAAVVVCREAMNGGGKVGDLPGRYAVFTVVVSHAVLEFPKPG